MFREGSNRINQHLLIKCYRFYKQNLEKYRWARSISKVIVKKGIVSEKQAEEVARAHRGYGFSPHVEEKSEVYDSSFDQYQELLGFCPLNLVVDATHTNSRLNILLPSINSVHLSGGPNTALILAAHISATGYPVRVIAVDVAIEIEIEDLLSHIGTLSGFSVKSIDFVDGSDRTHPIHIGKTDMFLATAWWTAQVASYAIKQTVHHRFLYLIQDYEPVLYASSSRQALCLDTYNYNYVPIVNTEILFEYLCAHRIGRFDDLNHQNNAILFDPAIDTSLFYPEYRVSDKSKRLLFYARPSIAERNLFEIALVALRTAIKDGVFDASEWEFFAMGEDIAPIALGSGCSLKVLPWLTLEEYAAEVRRADILISLMGSPHPSYPPLEKAASGGLAITNCFDIKDKARISALSPNIIAGECTLKGIYSAINEAVQRLQHGVVFESGVQLPGSWSESIEPIVPRILDAMSLIAIGEYGDSTIQHDPIGHSTESGYQDFRLGSLQRRREMFTSGQQVGLLSFITTVWDTDPEYLEVLARSVFMQDGGANFEWVILDNGSNREDTRELLGRIATHPSVTLLRVEENLGIVKGMRRVLETASGDYVMPLDSDDYLYPDCVNVVTNYVKSTSAKLLYTDEDKVLGDDFGGAYHKPDWDPALFTESCYIAHLCVFDRKVALSLGVYDDHRAEGCHDWDTFTRFLARGHRPFHIPEVLYSWRMHEASTAMNIASKDYISESHKYVLQKLAEVLAPGKVFRVTQSPLFQGTPDWKLVRAQDLTQTRVLHIFIVNKLDAKANEYPIELGDFGWRVSSDLPPSRLLELISGSDKDLLAILPASAENERGKITDAIGDALDIFDMHPDAALMTGRVVGSDGALVDGPGYLGYKDGCGCPDYLRPAYDPGYFAQQFKRHTVDAPSSTYCIARLNDFKAALSSFSGLQIASLHYLGPWVGAYVKRQSKRVVFSPYVSFESCHLSEAHAAQLEKNVFIILNNDLFGQSILPAALSREEPYKTKALDFYENSHVSKLAQCANADATAVILSQSLLLQSIKEYSGQYPKLKFSILTTVYCGTDGQFFLELAESISNQSHKSYEWIVLAHGPVAEALKEHLCYLEKYVRCAKVYWHEENLGIIGGMDYCLEQATGDFVIPVDSDDLLHEDALAALSGHIARTKSDFVYTDEDQLVGGEHAHPFLRGGWDPILAESNSYIWHLCCFNRKLAVTLGVYSDSEREYCHDWDTLLRFHFHEKKITHLPLVLYHWRTHTDSISNSGASDTHAGTLQSTSSILEEIISRSGAGDHLTVLPYPKNRGATELAVVRAQHSYEDVSAIIYTQGAADPVSQAILSEIGVPKAYLEETNELWEFGGSFLSSLHELDDTEYVLFLKDGCRPMGDHWLSDPVRILEMHPAVVAVSGRLVGPQGRLASCGLKVGVDGHLFDYCQGLDAGNPGAYAALLKQHSIFAPTPELMLVRRKALMEVITQNDIKLTFSALGYNLGSYARSQGLGIAYTPLMEAQQEKAYSIHREIMAVRKWVSAF